MSKRVKDSVHELIKSMTKAEKRYFKLMASRHTIGEENNYVVLFDAIEKQDEYDEHAIFDYFKGKAFLNKFSISKKRLYDQILHALDSFYCTSSIEAQLYKMLNSADILYDKSLYGQVRSILRSAEKLAIKNELYNILLLIRQKQKKLFENTSYMELSQQEIQFIFEEDARIHSQSLLYDKLWNVKSQLFHLLSVKGNSRNEKDIKEFKLIIDELAKGYDNKEWYFETLYLFHHIYSAYYFGINDYDKSLEQLLINVNLFEEKESNILKHPNKYFSVLTNAIYLSERLNQKNNAINLLQKLKLFSNRINAEGNEDLHIKLFSSISSLEINMLLKQGDFPKALKLISKIEKGIDEYDDRLTLPRKFYLLIKCAETYLYLKDFKNASRTLNSIINTPHADNKEDLLIFANILHVIVHVELKNYHFVQSSIKSVLRSFKQKNNSFEFEQIILNHINKISKIDNIFDQEQVWEALYKQLVSYLDGHSTTSFLDYFDIVSWLESKINNRSLATILANKIS